MVCVYLYIVWGCVCCIYIIYFFFFFCAYILYYLYYKNNKFKFFYELTPKKHQKKKYNIKNNKKYKKPNSNSNFHPTILTPLNPIRISLYIIFQPHRQLINAISLQYITITLSFFGNCCHCC